MIATICNNVQFNNVQCTTQHHAMCGTCGSPFLAGLGQHLPPVVAQQYLHVPGILQSARQFPPTDIVCGVSAYMCACTGNNKRLIPPVYIHSADSKCSWMLAGMLYRMQWFGWDALLCSTTSICNSVNHVSCNLIAVVVCNVLSNQV